MEAIDEQNENGIKRVSITVFPDGRISRLSAATLLNRKTKTLADWKLKGWGPRAIEVGGRIFYDYAECLAMARGEKPIRPEVV